MTQTTSRFFDELAKVMTNAAGAAQGVKREVETVVRAQAERIINDLDIVQREEFEAVREMAVRAREENERLEGRITELESALARSSKPAGRSTRAAASSKTSDKTARTTKAKKPAAKTPKT